MIPVILSGGSGTRLWPVSRENCPKQFCEFFDQSFLKNTIERLRPFGAPYIVTLQNMAALTERSAADLKLPFENIIYEPLGKNTAPAAALVCHLLSLKGQNEEVVGLFPADHLIVDTETFSKCVKLAVEEAAKNKIVTLGIAPSYAATGYGYVEIDQKPGKELAAYDVAAFREKPKKEVAERFASSGRHFWNAGIFFFKVSHMIALMKEHLPEVWSKISQVKSDLSNLQYNYANIEGISLDYGIMEKTTETRCIPCDIGWSDVGSWDEMARLAEEVQELNSNATIFTEDARKNFVYSMRPKLVGLIGVEGLIIVETPDALLVVKKGESQKVKNLVEAMRAARLPQVVEHRDEFN